MSERCVIPEPPPPLSAGQPTRTLPLSCVSSTCPACKGSHRKHTCDRQTSVGRPMEASAPSAALMLLPVKKRLSLTCTAAAVAPDDEAPPPAETEVATSCAACGGGHRKHTCGKIIAVQQKIVRPPDYCAACNGGHRKHTCQRRLSGGGGGGVSGSAAASASGSASSADKAQSKRRREAPTSNQPNQARFSYGFPIIVL